MVEAKSGTVAEDSGALSGVLVESDFRYFLSREVQRATRYQDFLSLCLVRAEYSGAPRPEVQTALARGIAAMLRSADIVGTIGSNVAVILVHTPDSDAARITERIRDRIQAQPFEAGGDAPPVRISLALGLASFPSDATAPDVLLDHAQTRLGSAA
jgi:PleD family two-component response regulator